MKGTGTSCCPTKCMPSICACSHTIWTTDNKNCLAIKIKHVSEQEPNHKTAVLKLPDAAAFNAGPHVAVTPTLKLFHCYFLTLISDMQLPQPTGRELLI